MSGPAGIRAELDELVALRARVASLRAAGRLRSRERDAGPRHAAFRGRGMEYAESRPYAPGDDVRHMDWRVTARTGKAHSKLFQAERDRVTALIVDRSPPMHFGTRGCLKLVQAARLAALAAWFAEGEGDRVAAWSGAERLAPARGRRGALRALAALARWTAEPPDAAALAPALDAASRLLHPGSRVLLALDHRSVDAALCDRIRRLAAHNDVAAVLVLDPIEIEAPPPGVYAASDGGTPVQLGLGEADRARWSQHFRLQRSASVEALRRAGASAIEAATTDDPVAVLRRLLRGGQAPGERAA